MRHPLTPRRREILLLAAAGLSHAEIAARLVVSINTVRKHMELVHGALDTHTTAQALAAALCRGLVSVEELRGAMEAVT